LRQAAAGRLIAAVRSLLSQFLAPQTWEVWLKALALFPAASPDLATPNAVAAAFAAEMREAAAPGTKASTPKSVTRKGITAAIGSAPRAKAAKVVGSPCPTPLGPRRGGARRARGGGYVVVGERVLALPRMSGGCVRGDGPYAYAEAGEVKADKLPGLRPIGLPETLRKLAASALAKLVRAAAAKFLAPLQLWVEVSNPWERLLKEVSTRMAAHPDHAVG